MKDKKSKIKSKVPEVVNNNIKLSPIVSKLNAEKKTDKNKPRNGIAPGNLPSISDSVKERIGNNETIIKLFSDIELSIQIMVSSIISPNDLLTTNLIYSAENELMPSGVTSALTETLKTYIKDEYNLENDLPTIIREALFTKGSYIKAIIPEASVDAMINVREEAASLEDFVDEAFKPTYAKGILDDSVDSDFDIGFEDYHADMVTGLTENELACNDKELGIEISDNYDVLFSKKITFEVIKNTVRRKIAIPGSAYSEESFGDIESLFKETPVHENAGVVNVLLPDETDKPSVGKPMVLKLPVEATIPVHVTGNPEDHIGYFILLDDKGVPVTDSKNWVKADEEMQNLYTDATGSTKSIGDKAKTALIGLTTNVPKIDNLEDIYSYIVDARIKKKLQGGVYGDTVDVTGASEIYRVMLNRVLRKQRTRLLFIPAELVSFYAFKYRDNGTGESLLETVSVLASIRAILLFSKLMANVKNSANNTEVSATLDESDPDPAKTMERIMSEAVKTRQTQLPIGVTRVEDLVDWSHKVGFKFNFKHSGLPDMEITTNDEGTSKVVPDSDLDEDIKKQMINSFGLNIEMVENGYSADFAATVVANNALFAKRVTKYQDTLLPMIDKNINVIGITDMDLQDKLRVIIKGNISSIKKQLKKNLPNDAKLPEDEAALVNWVLIKFIDSVKVSLPRPEMLDSNNLTTAYTNYKDSVEEFIEQMLSSDALPDELTGLLSDKMDAFKSAITGTLLRKWASENGYLPEIQSMISLDEEGKPMFDLMEEYGDYKDILGQVVTDFLKVNKKKINKTDKKLDKIDEDESTGDEPPVNDGTEPPVDGETPPADDGATPAEGDATPPEDTGEPTGDPLVDDTPAF